MKGNNSMKSTRKYFLMSSTVLLIGVFLMTNEQAIAASCCAAPTKKPNIFGKLFSIKAGPKVVLKSDTPLTTQEIDRIKDLKQKGEISEININDNGQSLDVYLSSPNTSSDSVVQIVSSVVPVALIKDTAKFKVDGMTCSKCDETVIEKVGRLKGVRSVNSNHEAGLVSVDFIRGRVTPAEISSAIRTAGGKRHKFSADLIDCTDGVCKLSKGDKGS